MVDKAIPYLHGSFGNPASRSHPFDWEAEKAVGTAHEQVAALVNADLHGVVWASGTTESDNLAIKGTVNFYSNRDKYIITMKTEHKAVLGTMYKLRRQGFEAAYLNMKDNNPIGIDVFRQAIRPDTILALVMMVNSEIGVIQDIEQLGEICREKGAIFHVDATQATGKAEIDLQKLKVDLMSSLAHKTYGPKGIGALYVRYKPYIYIEAQMHGGGHECGVCLDTLATHQTVGMGKAFRVTREEMAIKNERTYTLRDRLHHGLNTTEEAYVNDDMEARTPHSLSISFSFMEGESLIMTIKDIAVSSGSAHTLASLESSYVLRVLGRNDEFAHNSTRSMVGHPVTEEEIDYVVELLKGKIGKLRNLSLLREMYKDSADPNSTQWVAH